MCWLTKAWPIDNEGDCILEIGAESQNRTLARNRCDGSGGVAARSAQDGRTKHADAGDRIVNAARDWTFADQEGVGNPDSLSSASSSS